VAHWVRACVANIVNMIVSKRIRGIFIGLTSLVHFGTDRDERIRLFWVERSKFKVKVEIIKYAGNSTLKVEALSTLS